MTVLSVIQDHCRIHALAVPTVVIGNTTTTVQQLYGILSELLTEVVTESNFNVTTQEAVFNYTAAEDQGLLTTLAPNGFQHMLPETFFDRTLRRAVYGPLSETEWQAIKAIPNPGPFYKFRIRQGRLLINPVPAAPLSQVAFEYASSWPVKSAAGVLQAAIVADTDVFIFPENIIRKGLAFKWKLIKGLPYQSDETSYYNLLNNYIARNKAPRRINVACPNPTDLAPGIFVPSGNWNV